MFYKHSLSKFLCEFEDSGVKKRNRLNLSTKHMDTKTLKISKRHVENKNGYNID